MVKNRNEILYFLIKFPRKLFFFELGNPKVTVHKSAETIQGRKLFKGGNYMRNYGILFLELSSKRCSSYEKTEIHVVVGTV